MALISKCDVSVQIIVKNTIYVLKLANSRYNFLPSDKLGPTVFAPVKMDFVGNIKVSTFKDIKFSRPNLSF